MKIDPREIPNTIVNFSELSQPVKNEIWKKYQKLLDLTEQKPLSINERILLVEKNIKAVNPEFIENSVSSEELQDNLFFKILFYENSVKEIFFKKIKENDEFAVFEKEFCPKIDHIEKHILNGYKNLYDSNLKAGKYDFALDVAKVLKNSSHALAVFLNLAEVFIEQSNFAKAQECFNVLKNIQEERQIELKKIQADLSHETLQILYSIILRNFKKEHSTEDYLLIINDLVKLKSYSSAELLLAYQPDEIEIICSSLTKKSIDKFSEFHDLTEYLFRTVQPSMIS